jgi:ketosteroid isomerase-like protein
MSQENVEIARRGYRAFASGDPTEALSFLDPEFETYDFPEVPDTGVYRGQQGFVALVENVVGEFDDFRLEPEDFIALDEDHVLVIVRTLGRGKGSG